MDLEAILDAPDDSSEENVVNNIHISKLSSFDTDIHNNTTPINSNNSNFLSMKNANKTHHTDFSSRGGGAVAATSQDLERILREVDDDDDDYEEEEDDDRNPQGNRNIYTSGGGGGGINKYQQHHQHQHHQHQQYLLDDTHSLGQSTISTRPSQFNPSPYMQSRKTLMNSNITSSGGYGASGGYANAMERMDFIPPSPVQEHGSHRFVDEPQEERNNNSSATAAGHGGGGGAGGYTTYSPSRKISQVSPDSPVSDLPRIHISRLSRQRNDDENRQPYQLPIFEDSNGNGTDRNNNVFVSKVRDAITNSNSAATSTNSRHNAEEWAVLQTILNEADNDGDDDDDDEDNEDIFESMIQGVGMDPKSLIQMKPTSTTESKSNNNINNNNNNSSSHSKPPIVSTTSRFLPTQQQSRFTNTLSDSNNSRLYRQTSNASSLDVDAILNSMDDDSSTDDFGSSAGDFNDFIAQFSSGMGLTTNNINNNGAGSLSPSNKQSFHSRFPSNSTGSGSSYIYSFNKDTTSKQDDTFSTRISGQRTSPLINTKKTYSLSSSSRHSSSKTLSKQSDTLLDNKMATGDRSNLPTQSSSSSPKSTTKKYQHQINGSSTTISTSDAKTEAALANAQSYERRLLRPGSRDIVSPLMVKRRMKPKIELPTKSRATAAASSQQSSQQQQYKNNLINFNQSRFNFAGIIDIKSMKKISAVLKKNSFLRNELPTAQSISSKFIAIGTQRGIILVFDLFEELRQNLGHYNAEKNGGVGGGASSESLISPSQLGSVTSIDLSENGENLIAGYTKGTVVLWDILKGSMIKSTDDHCPSPISSIRFISEKNLNVVSVDVGGLVNKLSFVKTMLWSTYSVETGCLLDGTAGQILAMHVLPPFSSLASSKIRKMDYGDKKPSYHPSIHRLTLIALSSVKSSFAIAVEPSISVLHRWARPPPERLNVESFCNKFDDGEENETKEEEDGGGGGSNTEVKSKPPDAFLPCLSWGWALVSGGENCVTPILARAWGCCLQLLRANFPPFEQIADGDDDDTMHWPAFGVHDEFDISAPVVALEWLGDRSLIYLTFTNELTIVDTVMMTLVERLDFSGIKLVYAEFALSRAVASAINRTDSTAADEVKEYVSTTFQNSIRACDNRLLVLCQEEIKSVSILGIEQRVATLEEGGEWLEALALALDHYESTIKSQENNQRNEPDRERSIANHPEFVSRARISEDEEWMAELLLRYVNLAIENAPEKMDQSFLNEDSIDAHLLSPRIDLVHSHYQMLAGVCIEFCVVTRRLDILFNEVYEHFVKAHNTPVFLDVLEPYVLNDKLHYIAPIVMAQFVEHCKETNDVATVERCLLHMDVTIVDFDSILSLLRKNGMFSALIHVFTHGLDDYRAPLETLFEAIFDAADDCQFDTPRRADGVPQSNFERLGYKAILYLRHCFNGRTFPTDKPIIPESRVKAIIPQLLKLLTQREHSPSTDVRRSETSSSENSINGQRHVCYPYMHSLMMIDAKALLDTLSLIFDSPDVQFAASIDSQDNVDEWQAQAEINLSNSSLGDEGDEGNVCPDRMDIVRILWFILLSLESVYSEAGNSRNQNLQVAKDCFHDFLAKYLAEGIIRTPPEITLSVFSLLSSRLDQDKVIHLLQVLPRNSYKRDDVLKVVEKYRMSRAALFLHKLGVTELFEGRCDIDKCTNHFRRAIECYMEDEDPKFQREVFHYIKKECVGGGIPVLTYESSKPNDDETTVHDVLRNVLCDKLCSLVNLDPVLCSQLVAELYIEDLDKILASLDGAEAGMVQFKFFHSVISGELTKVDLVAGPVLLANLTIDHHQKYLELMARFHPNMVYQHLTTHDNYRVEECLKLCQEYEIADASAYLLERLGNVSSALQLMLQTLEGRLMALKRVIRGLSTTTYRRFGLRRGRGKNEDNPLVNEQKNNEIKAVKQMLTVALDLCERNADSHSIKAERGSQLWFNVLDRLINAKGFLRLSKELPTHASAMLNVLSDLLRMTMQRMVSKVSLPDLVRKITTDHASNRLGEFRTMLETMLKTYASELDVFTNAVDVMKHDVFQMSLKKRQLKVQGEQVTKINGHRMSQFLKVNHNNKDKPSILRNIGNGNATFDRNKEDKESDESKEVTKSKTLSRLKKKRRGLTADEKRKKTLTLPVQYMMTVDEKDFAVGESSDAAYMTREIGILSDAISYGKLG